MELGIKNNIKSKLIDNKNDIDLMALKGKSVIGLTAGASAPQILLDEVTEYLIEQGAFLEDLGQPSIKEDIIFSIPKELRKL